jgi:hypothetical protein
MTHPGGRAALVGTVRPGAVNQANANGAITGITGRFGGSGIYTLAGGDSPVGECPKVGHRVRRNAIQTDRLAASHSNSHPPEEPPLPHCGQINNVGPGDIARSAKPTMNATTVYDGRRNKPHRGRERHGGDERQEHHADSPARYRNSRVSPVSNGPLKHKTGDHGHPTA